MGSVSHKYRKTVRGNVTSGRRVEGERLVIIQQNVHVGMIWMPACADQTVHRVSNPFIRTGRGDSTDE